MPPSLVEYSREQLAENEQAIGDGTGRIAWWHIVSARVFRFLLSFYPEVEPPRSPCAPGGTEGDQVLDESWEGKPARSDELIRQRVTAIHQTHAPSPEVGPLVDGLPEGSWILVSRHPVELYIREVIAELKDAGIPTQTYARQGDWCVEVPVDRRADARRVLEEAEIPRPDPAEIFRERKRRTMNLLVGMVVFAFIGATLGGMIASAFWMSEGPSAVWTMAFVGMMCGGTLGAATRVVFYLYELGPAR